MGAVATSKQTVELNRNGLRSHLRLDFDSDNKTRELYRPGIDIPDRTVELGECDLEVLAAPRSTSTPPPTPPAGDTWSLETLVEVDDDFHVEVEVEPEFTPLEPEHKGFLWRILFKLGWVRQEEPLGYY